MALRLPITYTRPKALNSAILNRMTANQSMGMTRSARRRRNSRAVSFGRPVTLSVEDETMISPLMMKKKSISPAPPRKNEVSAPGPKYFGNEAVSIE